jgi:hypothetical protein
MLEKTLRKDDIGRRKWEEEEVGGRGSRREKEARGRMEEQTTT